MATDSITTIARPYAKAVFELALEENALNVWSNMLQLMATVAADSDVQALVDSPSVSTSAVVDFFLEVCGKHINEQGNHLLQLLAANDRVLTLPEISAMFECLKAEQEKTLDVEVLAFNALNDKQEKALYSSLKKRLSREINLKVSIDKSLLGGAVVHAGSLVIDGSVRTKLENLNLGLQEA